MTPRFTALSEDPQTQQWLKAPGPVIPMLGAISFSLALSRAIGDSSLFYVVRLKRGEKMQVLQKRT